MALNGDILGLAIKAAIGSFPQDRALTSEEEDNMWKAMGGAIVSHITSNAVIDTTVTTIVATPDTLTGTGAGTGIGTVS